MMPLEKIVNEVNEDDNLTREIPCPKKKFEKIIVSNLSARSCDDSDNNVDRI